MCAELDETATRVENDDEHGGGDDENARQGQGDTYYDDDIFRNFSDHKKLHIEGMGEGGSVNSESFLLLFNFSFCTFFH